MLNELGRRQWGGEMTEMRDLPNECAELGMDFLSAVPFPLALILQMDVAQALVGSPGSHFREVCFKATGLQQRNRSGGPGTWACEGASSVLQWLRQGSS